MWFERPVKIMGYTHDQQSKVDWLWDLLNNPNTILDSNQILTDTLRIAGSDSDVLHSFGMLQKDRFYNLKRDFSRNIFHRGLYAAADDSTSKTLTSEQEGVYVGTLWMAGRLMITISSGEAGNEDYRQITFICDSDNPSDMAVNSYYGKLSDLNSLVKTAAERFKDLQAALTVMRPDSVNFAGLSIGTPGRPRSRRSADSSQAAPQ